MVYEALKFRLVYLGRNTSGTTPPSYSSAVNIGPISFICPRLSSVPSQFPYNSNVVCGTVSSSGVPTYNSVGTALDNLLDFSTNTIIGTDLSKYIAYYSKANVFLSYICNRIYYLEDYLGSAALSGYYWFAYVNSSNHYVAVRLNYSSSGNAALITVAEQGIYDSSGNRLSSNSPQFATQFNNINSSNGNFSYVTAGGIFKVGSVYYPYYLAGITNGNLTAYRPDVWERDSVLQNFLVNSDIIPPAPYPSTSESTENEGGNGSFDNTTSTVPVPSVPTASLADAGFVRIYNPTLAQLKDLSDYMWTDSTFVQTLLNHAKQLLEDPIESIISLKMLPCIIPNGSDVEVKVLYIPTGVQMPPVTTQFVEVDCGSFQLTEYYGSALDYSPHTRVYCYLPYIGQVTLDTDEVMGKTLSIKYRIDIASGTCVALVSVNGSVMYQYSGNCSIDMPLTSADFMSYVSAGLSAAKAVAGVAAAAAGAPGVSAALLGTSAPQSTTTKTTERNPKTGRQITSGTKTVSKQGASFGEVATAAASNTVGAVMGSKMQIEHASGFSGNSGYLAVRRPYLTIVRPRMCYPTDYGKFNGYPSMLTLSLGDCSGFTQVSSVHLTGFSATNPELSEISTLLKAGVVL